jgi:hypothetical protein
VLDRGKRPQQLRLVTVAVVVVVVALHLFLVKLLKLLVEQAQMHRQAHLVQGVWVVRKDMLNLK